MGSLVLGFVAAVASLIAVYYEASKSGPPCSDRTAVEGSCRSRNVTGFSFIGAQSPPGMSDYHHPASTVEAILEKGLREIEASPTHIVVRGTAQADSIRCDWRGVARTVDQRDPAVRFWLGIDETENLPSPGHLADRFMVYVNQISPRYRATWSSNASGLARGGLNADTLFLACYADYSVDEYLLGAGADTITLGYDHLAESRSYDLYLLAHASGEFKGMPLKQEGEYRSGLDNQAWAAETLIREAMGNHETVVFLSPMGAHGNVTVEVWQVVAQWDLQIDQTSTVNAVRIGADEKDPEFTQTLANLRTRIETAAASDAFAGKRIANINGLNDHYVEIGAYDDITPGDDDTTTFTPAQPPLALTCASGTAVTGPEDNRPLVHDCEVLVDNEGALSGTATLNWSVDTSIDSWDGVVTGGTPTRITELDLPSNSLTGTIPAKLGTLSGLTVLDLSGNQLTGEIPHEIGWLFNLTEIGLSGNSLTGCIPVALEDVATNDFSSMSLLFCQPPPPENLAAGAAAETNIPLTWDSVSNTSKYRVEYRLDRVGDWAVHDETITLASHAADSLNCETAYQFRVSAFGSGTNYEAAWSGPSLPVSATTTQCTSPVFDPSSYTFALAEGTAIDDVVGTVTARHPGGGSLTYSITAGNDDGNFNIDGTSGEITAATASPTTLTIEAAATGIQSATATVEIYIARTPMSPAPTHPRRPPQTGPDGPLPVAR